MITVKANFKSLDELTDWLDGLPDQLNKKADELVRKLANLGVEVANVYYEKATYAGTNDVIVEMLPGDKRGRAKIRASGTAVLFIEFGTGVLNPYDASEAKAKLADASAIVPHGQYGEGRANSPFGWYYKGDMPSNPPTGTTLSYKGRGLIHTYGEAAQPIMYESRKAVIEQVETIAREVFKL